MALFLCFREDEHHLIAQYCSSLNGDPSAQAVSPPASLCSHVCVVPAFVSVKRTHVCVVLVCFHKKRPHADHVCVVPLCFTENVQCQSSWMCCTSVFQSVFHADHDGCVVPVCFSQCSMQIMMAVLYWCVSVEKPDADHDGCGCRPTAGAGGHH